MIQGTISEFESGDGHNLGDWNVVLEAAGIVTPIVRADGSTDGRQREQGEWTAFHGRFLGRRVLWQRRGAG